MEEKVKSLYSLIVLTGHVLRRLDLSNMTHYPSPMLGKSRAYFEAISLLPKHVGKLPVHRLHASRS